VLACGRAPWLPRRIGDRDLVWWLRSIGFLDMPFSALADPAMRLVSNPLTTGHGGGHDLHLRTLRAAGVTLAGRFTGVDDGRAVFDGDLGECVAWADARHAEFAERIRATCRAEGWPDVELAPPEPFVAEAPTEMPVDRFSSVIVTGGFRPNYGGWMPWPEAFDALGFPTHVDGESDVVDGLFFVGVHFLRKRKSAILLGAREDSAVVADRIARRLGAAPAS
jgi:putative flavoprotein involved in K+ transport